MALKLPRRAERVTNENLEYRSSRRHREPLGTRAVSFKRVLGAALSKKREQWYESAFVPGTSQQLRHIIIRGPQCDSASRLLLVIENGGVCPVFQECPCHVTSAALCRVHQGGPT